MRVASDHKAPFDTLDDAGMDAPATLPGATDVDIGLLGQKFSDRLDIELGG